MLLFMMEETVVLLSAGNTSLLEILGTLQQSSLETRLIRQVQLQEEIDGNDVQTIQHHLESFGLRNSVNFRWDLFGGRK